MDRFYKFIARRTTDIRHLTSLAVRSFLQSFMDLQLYADGPILGLEVKSKNYMLRVNHHEPVSRNKKQHE